ncbi:MAG: dTDP-4-dehydrorhamnose 3,5-epimerase [Bacteroidota bacterium]
MEIIKVDIEGPLILKPAVYKDARGYFYESYNAKTLANMGFTEVFVQDNESLSSKGVVRGLHFQLPPFSQGKLVKVVMGSVYDVAVDLRKNSPTYGQWSAIELSAENKLMFWIPAGFAHGFQSLEENTIFSYKCTNYYDKNSEASLLFNDPDIGINWPIANTILAEKDLQAGLLNNFDSPFQL